MAEVTGLQIKVESSGITEATANLTALVKVASDAGIKISDFAQASKEVSKELPASSSSIDKLLASFEKQNSLLGSNVASVNAYKLSMQEATPSQIQLGMALGAGVDAFKILQKSQTEAIKMNQSFDASAKTSAEAARMMAVAIAANQVGPTRQTKTDNTAAIKEETRAQQELAIAVKEVEQATRVQAEIYANTVGPTKQIQQSGLASLKIEAEYQKILATEIKNLSAAEAEETKISQSRQMSSRNADVSAYNTKLKELTQTFKNAADAEKAAQAVAERTKVLADTATAANEKWIASLTREAGAIGLTGEKLRAYNADLLRAEAAQRGVSAQAEPMIKKLQDTEKAASGAHSGVAGISRELIVMAHEVSQGQFTRLGGSVLVLAERLNVVPNAILAVRAAMVSLEVSMAPIIIGFAGIAAVIGTLGFGLITFLKSQQTLKEFRNEVILTGGSAGATGDQFYDMARKVGDSTGALGLANEAMLKLVGSGKFTAKQIQEITESAVGLDKYGGVSIEKTIANFEKLAKEPLNNTERSIHQATKAAVSMDESLHFLNPSILHTAFELENVGKNAEASGVLISALTQVSSERVEELKTNITEIGQMWNNFTKSLKKDFNSIFDKGSITDRVEEAKIALEKLNNSFGVKTLGYKPTEETKAYNDLVAEATRQKDKADKDAHTSEIKRAATLANSYRDQLEVRIKGEDRVNVVLEKQKKSQEDLLAYDKIHKNDIGYKPVANTPEQNAAQIAFLTKEGMGKVVKPPAEGMTETNLQLSNIAKLEDAKKYAAEQEIKQIDSLVRYSIMGIEEGANKKNEILKREYEDLKKSIQDQINYIDSHKLPTSKLEKQDQIKRNTLVDNLSKASSAEDTRTQDNLNRITAADAKGEKEATKAFETSQKQSLKELELLKDKHTAYQNLDETFKKSGVTEKQMADLITQARIDSIEATNKLAVLSNEEIDRNIAKIQTLKDIRDAQKANEDDAATNAKNLATQAAIKSTSSKLGDDLADAILEGGTKGYLKLLKQMELDFAKAVLKPLLSPITDAMASGGSELSAFGGAANGSVGSFVSGLLGKGVDAAMNLFGTGSSIGAMSSADSAVLHSDVGYGDFAEASGAAFASGGTPEIGKQSLVGESGPEMFVPKTSGTIIPNSVLKGNAGNHTINYSPSISIDSRSDSAQIYTMVNGAVKQGNADLIEGLSRAGKI